jgi:hypothetical protein
MKPFFKTRIQMFTASASVLLVGLLAGSGCTRQAFIVGRNLASQAAPGSYIIPPKVDILLVEDDTGSMAEAQPSIIRQMPGLLNQMEANHWDYHFATAALTNTDRVIDQVAVSRYDSNYGAAWMPPYPGADPLSLAVPSFVFRTTSTYNQFLGSGDINNNLAGYEPGFEGIRDAFERRLPDTGFLRDDALLVVLVVGNGNDNSLVNLCRRSDNVVVPCEQLGKPACTSLSQYDPAVDASQCGSASLSYQYYKNGFMSLKPDPSQIRFFAAVSNYNSSSCLNGYSTIGSRYQRMAGDLHGQSFDICKQPVGTALSGLASSLQIQRLQFETRYLFIEEEPDVSTIEVLVYRNGDKNQAESIPMDPDNGWTYAGYVSDVYAIDAPIEMNLSSGFAIELHGAAKLVGNDSADVTYTAAGISNSAPAK